MSGWLSRLFDTSAVPQDYTAPANQLGPLARQVMTNPMGTETVSPYASQSVGVPRGGFDPLVDPGASHWPGQRPMLTQSQYDATRNASLDLFNQAALVAGSPAAEEGAAVGAVGRRPVPMEPAPPGAPTGGAPEVWSPPPPSFRSYHGSQGDFSQFDDRFIGTGEGHQAFGYGHYVAENEGVARGYRDQLRPDPTELPEAQPLLQALQHDDYLGFDSPWDAVRAMRSHPDYTQRWDVSLESEDAFKAYEAARNATRGHMYEVNIAADPAHFLDWDKPLSEQSPHVQQALEQSGHMDDARRYFQANARRFPDGPTGEDLHEYIRLAQGGVSDRAPADTFHQAGIPGIRYLDAGSRGAGSGTRNTVVFDPATLEILRKYGIAGLLGGTGAVAGTQQPSQ